MEVRHSLFVVSHSAYVAPNLLIRFMLLAYDGVLAIGCQEVEEPCRYDLRSAGPQRSY